jgi:transposase, IS30 family
LCFEFRQACYDTLMKNNTHFTKAERDEISILLTKRYSHRAIAAALGRHHDSIDTEIRLNSTKGIYDSKKAHAKARLRRRKAKYQSMKLREDSNLCTYVETKLQEDWSPEEISGRLKYRESWRGYISFFAIYRYLETVWGERWKRYLRYQGKSYGTGKKDAPIDGRVMIDQRPKNVDTRRIFGHWEADFIVSGKKDKGALLVFVERKTKYVLLFKLKNRKVDSINRILETITGAQLFVASLTIDNDVCFRHHKEMSRILHTPIFFCHPYHSWEKGTVENMNKWIRQYVPKGTSISTLSESFISQIQNRLNSRPRKCLQFYTPTEMFDRDQALQQKVEFMIPSVKQALAELRG